MDGKTGFFFVNDEDNLSTHGLPSLPGWLPCFLKSLLKIVFVEMWVY